MFSTADPKLGNGDQMHECKGTHINGKDVEVYLTTNRMTFAWYVGVDHILSGFSTFTDDHKLR